jgi:cellulose biosynthesis protein BcsQ
MVGSPQFGFDIPFIKEVIAGVVGVSGFAYSCYKYGRRAGSKSDKARIAMLTSDNKALGEQLEQFDKRFKSLEGVVKAPQDFWLRQVDQSVLADHQLALSTSVPIISVVNFKGGVGKTTICANLAAYFAGLGKRVLLIDCDYQGSLSDTVLSHARVEDFKANAHLLMEGGHDPAVLRAAAERLSSIDSRLWIYPAFYGFSRSEIQMMFRWLIGQDSEIRFNISRYLQSAPFKVDAESAYDIVLIDAPPRLLTGVVNALSASTHVLIPTILDGQSHIATLNTVSAIQQFRAKLNPQLRILGVVPSMVSTSTGYNAREEQFITELERQMPEHFGSPVQILKGRPIWRREELAKVGGSEILYSSDTNTQAARDIRAMFSRLGGYVAENVRWRDTAGSGEVIAMPGQARRRVAG